MKLFRQHLYRTSTLRFQNLRHSS